MKRGPDMATTPFDEVIHSPNRLRVCAMLRATDAMEFSTVRDELGVSDSVLSKQIKILSEAGYVGVRKVSHNPRRRTWLYLTPDGSRALEGHLAELRRIANVNVESEDSDTN